MAGVYEKLESWVLPIELEDKGLENTLQCDPYEDETQNKQRFPQLAEELEPMPEKRDHYIGAEILLLKGDEMARGHVVAQSHNANENIIDRAHKNPILDTRTYQVEFAGGKVTELMTNVIAQSIYVQCDADRNEYLLLDALVYYHKDNKAISLKEQQTSIWGRPVYGTDQYMGQTNIWGRPVTHMTTVG